LVLESQNPGASPLVERFQADCDLIRVDSMARCLGMLRSEPIAGVFINPADEGVRDETKQLFRSDRILGALCEGVAVVNADLRVLWANPAFEKWCGGSATGKVFYDALCSPATLGPDYYPLYAGLSGKSITTRLHCRDNRHLELHITPLDGGDTPTGQIICLARDVTAEVQQQQKLDALHRAGRELAALSTEQINEMSVGERVELLKADIRRYTHDLLHYDVIEIRMLDRQTGRLEPLLSEGMTPEAAQRVLYAEVKDNGVTGYVAATGKSYLCSDTAHDPHYIRGAADARSSITVPLLVQDRVIGTFNVESPKPNAFGEEDMQFAEIFSRELAEAIHTLDLLSAEKQSTTSRSIEAISREVALPVDDILTAATAILDRYVGHEPAMAEKLRKILASARAIKETIQRVGEDLVPTRTGSHPGVAAHPRLRGLRVLVADNDERMRRSAHSILGRWGCVVETARDGQEALTLARLSTYDAILADIRLPDLPGYEVFRRLRDVQPEARVILMTSYGYDATHSLVKARQEGLQCVLYKPFRVDQLMEALTKPAPVCPSPAPPAMVRS
jgi:CheY-like chemotaxis protein